MQISTEQLQHIGFVLSQLVEFIERPEIQAAVDGAYDPELAVQSAKQIIEEVGYRPPKDHYAESA